MVYECEDCGSALPAGVKACVKCGSLFEEAVPQDAETATRGWQPKTAGDSSSQLSADPGYSEVTPETTQATLEQPDPAYIPPNIPDKVYWHSKAEQVKGKIRNAAASPAGKKFQSKRLLLGLGLLIIAVVLVVLIRPHTNAYVFEQHPLYQANVAAFCHPPPSSLLGQMGAEFVWPYEGHENQIKCILHSNGSSGIGSDPSAPVSKSDLDQEAIEIRALFCQMRYRSGFMPDEAMQCQVYVSFNDASETGYDGPEVAPDRDAVVKRLLDQVQ